MKNHIKVNGKLLQTDKKWKHLKKRQQEKIYFILKEKYINFVSQNKRYPKKEEKITILDEVYQAIREKEIWIPYGEFRKFFLRKELIIRRFCSN